MRKGVIWVMRKNERRDDIVKGSEKVRKKL